MQIPPFEHLEPETLTDALVLLAQYKEEAKVIAGGTELLPKMKKKILRPRVLVNIKPVPGLRYIEEEDDTLSIGSLTPLQEIAESALINDRLPLLAEAARSVGAYQLRNMGTIGGNLCQDTRCQYYDQSFLFGQEVWPRCFKRGGDRCHTVTKGKRCYAVYSGDVAPILVALGANIKVKRIGAERTIKLSQMFSGSGDKPRTLQPDEILTDLIIPKPSKQVKGAYLKYRERGTLDYAIVGVGTLVTFTTNGKVEDAKIVLTSVGASPLEAVMAEEMMRGRELTETVADGVAHTASKEVHLVSNHGYSAWYLREMVKVFVKRACLDVLEQIRARREK